MRAPLLQLAIPLALLAAACEPLPDPMRPGLTSPTLSTQQGVRTSVFPNLDGSFGPIVLASCEEGYDLIYRQEGTVTVIETTDQDGIIQRLQFVWDLTLTVSNAETGFSLSGPSHGPDQITFNSDGTVRLVQLGLVGMLKSEDGSPLTIDAGRIEFRIDESGASIVEMYGPHPHHEGYPERPVLCALVNH